MLNNFVLISKTIERRAVSADLSRQKFESKEYLPDWLEPKKAAEDKSSDYVQDKLTPTEELFNKHRRSSSDKIVPEAGSITDIKMILLIIKNGFHFLNYLLQVENVSQEDKIMIAKSLPHEKESLSKSLDNQKIDINEQGIEDNYSKVSLKYFLKKENLYMLYHHYICLYYYI